MKKEQWYIAMQVALAAFVVAMFLTFFGCSATKVVPMPHLQDSTRVHVEIKHDSIFVDRWHAVKEKGDTIWLRDSIYVEKWREKYICDTIRTYDSIPYKVEVIKEVRKRNGYDKFTARGFWILLAIFVLVVGLRVYLRFKGIK